MTLRKVKWVFLLTLIAFLLILQYARYLLEPYQTSLGGRLTMDAVVLVLIVFFFGAVLSVISRLQERLERQNRELEALHLAALDVYGEQSLETVLQKVVDRARQLLEARYGAVAVIGEDQEIRQFVISGLGREEVEKIGAPPTGSGLLGIVLREGQRLRLADLTRHPRSAGMPPHHPAMRSLLAVPVVCKGPFRGNLYVAEKETAEEFTADDEETLVRFSTEAALAIDNTHLQARLRTLAVAEERVRIARELHDGLAQVLAYVSTKAQAVKTFLERRRPNEAAAQLEQLAAAARDVYADAREGILALRTHAAPDRPLAEALRDFLEHWQDQSGIPGRLVVTGELKLGANAELQLLRIVQEALSNARKHSRAGSVEVELVQADGKVVVEVRDDGAGFDPAARSRSDFPRFGLAIMRERAESIGGSMRLDSYPGRGTKVRIELPTGTENP